MKKQLINEAFRFQRLAGIITENEYMEKNTSIYESSLSPEEKKVYDDIVNTLNESDNIIDIIKSYAKKGLITIGILAALLTGSQLSQNQKAQVIDTVETEMSADQDLQNYLLASKAHDVTKSYGLEDEIAKLAEEDLGVHELLKYEFKNWDKLSHEQQTDVGKFNKDECQKLIDLYNNIYTNTAKSLNSK